MNEIINWAAQHNTLVIQVAFSIVLVLILFYVYRLFFVNSGSSGSIESSAELGELSQKLTQLLEQQKNTGIQVIEKVVAPVAGVVAATDATASANGDVATELEQLRAENVQLKTQLNESEKKVFELTPIAGPEESLKEEAPKVDPAQLTALNKKVEELQSRLSEYDIIADDIAELSQLRTENADLKKKMKEAGGEAVPTEEASKAEPVSESPVVAASEAPPEAPTATAQVEAPLGTDSNAAGGVPGFDAETSALLNSLVAETDAAAAKAVTQPADPSAKAEEKQAEEKQVEEPQEKLVMDQNVPEGEKNLINEFEKSIQKGS